MNTNLAAPGCFTVAVWFLSCAASAACHEFGHWLCGRRQGGRFLLMRVGWLVWLGGGITPWVRPGRYRIPGQCAMLCGSVDGYCRMALGGIRANLFLSAVCLWGMLVFLARTGTIPGMLALPGILFPCASFLSALVNLLPAFGSDGEAEKGMINAIFFINFPFSDYVETQLSQDNIIKTTPQITFPMIYLK